MFSVTWNVFCLPVKTSFCMSLRVCPVCLYMAVGESVFYMSVSLYGCLVRVCYVCQ